MWPFKKSVSKEEGEALCKRLKAVEVFAPVGSIVEYLGVKMMVVEHHQFYPYMFHAPSTYVPGLKLEWMDSTQRLQRAFLRDWELPLCKVLSTPENKEAALKQGEKMKDKILTWFATGRVGASSKAMACCLIDSETDRSHPYDPDDLNRCLLFLEAVPEARQCMDKLRTMSVTWDMLIENWEQIEQCFLDEVGLNWCKANRAPKTYELMDKIQKAARQKIMEEKQAIA